VRGAGRLALSSDGASVYVTSRGGATWGLAAFARDATTGALTQLPGLAGCVSSGLSGCERARQLNRPQDLLVAPDGRQVYVAAARESPTGAFGEGPGGGIAVLARDPRTGQLTQRSGARGCTNRRGEHGCRRDPRIGMRERLAITADGRTLYSVSSRHDEGPRVSPIAPDGSIRRSTGAAGYPDRPDGPDALALDSAGRAYVRSADGIFAYTPLRARSDLRLADCWVSRRRVAPCRRDDVVLGVSVHDVVAAPDGTAVYFNGEGILTLLRE
jgi:DNA-binding beta-propeller fold protein YncE